MNIEYCRDLIETFVQERDLDEHNDKAGKKGLKGDQNNSIKLIENLQELMAYQPDGASDDIIKYQPSFTGCDAQSPDSTSFRFMISRKDTFGETNPIYL